MTNHTDDIESQSFKNLHDEIDSLKLKKNKLETQVHNLQVTKQSLQTTYNTLKDIRDDLLKERDLLFANILENNIKDDTTLQNIIGFLDYDIKYLETIVKNSHGKITILISENTILNDDIQKFKHIITLLTKKINMELKKKCKKKLM